MKMKRWKPACAFGIERPAKPRVSNVSSANLPTQRARKVGPKMRSQHTRSGAAQGRRGSLRGRMLTPHAAHLAIVAKTRSKEAFVLGFIVLGRCAEKGEERIAIVFAKIRKSPGTGPRCTAEKKSLIKVLKRPRITGRWPPPRDSAPRTSTHVHRLPQARRGSSGLGNHCRARRTARTFVLCR